MANEDVCHTEDRSFLRSCALRRATCAKSSCLRGDHSNCADQDQYAHHDCTYDEPYYSVTPDIQS